VDLIQSEYWFQKQTRNVHKKVQRKLKSHEEKGQTSGRSMALPSPDEKIQPKETLTGESVADEITHDRRRGIVRMPGRGVSR
jgi:hypothetical protein